MENLWGIIIGNTYEKATIMPIQTNYNFLGKYFKGNFQMTILNNCQILLFLEGYN